MSDYEAMQFAQVLFEFLHLFIINQWFAHCKSYIKRFLLLPTIM